MSMLLRLNLPVVLAAYVLLLSAMATSAKPVDQETARRVAITQHRLAHAGDGPYPTFSSASFSLAYQARAAVTVADTQTVYYVFNAPNASGFVIVAGDDAVEPVLGYSTTGSFSMSRPSPEFMWWMGLYQRQIVDAARRHVIAPAGVARMWEAMQAPTQAGSTPAPVQAAAAVGPLLKTEWDQSPYYNALCPFDRSANERTVTGCVATAVSQIMKYHNYPQRGRGDHGYSHQAYGYLYANFANATYNWAAMPNRVTGPNDAVALLMYHVGVSCDMSYGTGSSGGSGAYPSDAAEALKRYFDYKETVRNVERSSYNDNAWNSLIRSELDNSRPVEYHGFGDGSGHSFVCDGYNGNYFHINWGWDGQYNGYFLLSDLTPDNVGTGGGSGSYNTAQGAIIGIEPGSPVAGEASLEMAANLRVSPNPSTANGIVTVTFDLHNTGTSTFKGDYCVALFDADGQFTRYLGGVWQNMQLGANNHYTNGLTSRDTLFGVYPGTYTAVVFAKPTDQEWVPVAAGSYTNQTELVLQQAQYASDLRIYDVPTTQPDQVHAGETFTLHTDFANDGQSRFNGDISVWAYTLDGNTEIGQLAIREGLTLNANNHYTNGLTFNCSALDVPAGKYMLALFNRDQGGDWQFINPGDYVNPIIIDILPSVLAADRYEPNDAQGSAARLSLSFSGGNGTAGTDGANIHASRNDDYYRIDLPAGYDYTFHAVLHDSWTDEAAGYTNDVSVMWNAGEGWSDVYDDSTDAFTVRGGRALLLKVQSLFLGTLGTYDLDLRATRTTSAVPADPETPHLALEAYPNPASTSLDVRLDPRYGRILELSLLDAAGRSVRTVAGDAVGSALHLDVADIPSGAYIVRATTDRGTLVRRVMVQH